jgi:hypothetical protein
MASLSFHFAALMVVLSVTRAHAANPVVSVKLGEPVRLVFSDGREAVMKVSTVAAPDFTIPFAVTETLCSDHQNIHCSFNISAKSQTYFFAWEKNPDAAKINQQLMVNGSGTNLTEQAILVIGAEAPYAPIISAGTHQPRMVCDDFSWLPEGKAEAPASARIVRWESEFMFANPETGANENRSLGGAFNVTLQRDTPKSLALSGIESMVDVLGVINSQMIFLFAGSSLSLVIDNHKGDTCQATIQTDGGAIQAQAGQLKRPDAATEKNVYIVGSDELLSRPRLFDFKTFFANLAGNSEGLFQ